MSDGTRSLEFTAEQASDKNDADAAGDLELILSVQNGDEDAFEHLFTRHVRRVAMIGSRFFRNQEQIEEIVQEAFSKAYFALKDFKVTENASFGAWISRIAFNCCYDELRRIKRHPETDMADVSQDDQLWLNQRVHGGSFENVESQLISRDLATKLLSRLKPEDRFLLVLLEAEEMSVSEIAEITGWSVSKVKVRAHRARLAMRKVLKRFV
jgi:RNA polymerase sigma-70 factor, ECF subfamily